MEERAEQPSGEVIPDDRLRLMFACAHPAIAPPMRSPLILQAVLGLDAGRLSEAFLVAPATMGQRLVRAKAKIKDAGIPFRVPDAHELPERLDAVLEAVYAAYGTGWDDVDDLDAARRDLVPESIRLARLLAQLLPSEPEVRGLLALILHSHARHDARRDEAGAYVPLAQQDTARWSRALVEEAEQHLAAALAGGRPGPYQLQAAIQSLHNRRSATGTTNWARDRSSCTTGWCGWRPPSASRWLGRRLVGRSADRPRPCGCSTSSSARSGTLRCAPTSPTGCSARSASATWGGTKRRTAPTGPWS